MAILLVVLAGCTPQGEGGGKTGRAEPMCPLKNQPVAAFQTALLELAFDAPASMPVVPHLKNRSRIQGTVVTACLKLGQPELVSRFIPDIGNWRRGMAYADMAVYCVEHDCHDVQPLLDLAAEIADTATQDWRRDRVRVRIAQAHALLGQSELAARFAADVEPSESGKLAGTAAAVGDDEAFDAQVAALDSLIAGGQFDVMKNALLSYTQVFDRHYDNTDRRKLIEKKIESGSATLPLVVRIDLMLKMAGFALEHRDPAGSLALVNTSQSLMDSAQWPARFGIPLRGRLAAMRFLAGDTAKARGDVDAALAEFDSQRDAIQSFDRGGVLRPLAEAYQQMGDAATALSIYRRAVEAGAVNPNLRPRTEDLSATCCSMAVHGVEPDEALWKRMHDIRRSLGQPQ